MIKFSILFDNYRFDRSLQSLWGFSCLIELENQTILFDTGSNGRVLLSNAKKMGIDFKNIDTLFISHSHWDHIGGIDTVIEENPNIKLILPSSLSKHLIKNLKSMVKDVKVIEAFTQLDTNLYSTGMMSDVKEQSLIIEQDDELYLISGCGHPGIENIADKTKQLNKPIKYILGGFHLLRSSDEEVDRTISSISTDFITATHCTGEKAIKTFKNHFKDKFLKGGVGAVIKI